MGLVPRFSSAEARAMPIDRYMVSTGVISAFSVLEPPQTTRDPEIPQASGTDRLLSIFRIPVTIETHVNAIVVTDYIIHMYGVGSTIQEAVADYKISIKAYFQELQEDEDRLGSNLKEHLYYLLSKSKYFE